ncbi:tetratricopeptide repeat protein [Lentzea sp. NEAU-D13]|uniref:Tetratricopeptide repeat protein n=1 Tax=Lentzea alba TaxID=2714351 RepID=A0A7C9VUW7_9PSEU|nr:NB-ARC domain-containing protein [Lentzea alba]NGY63632.1 tetratricopeptide repeat protein [Lentzea alba]
MSEDDSTSLVTENSNVGGNIVQIGIVRGDVSLATDSPTTVVPRQLPADVALFTGRVDDMGRLEGFLQDIAGADTSALVISAIAGTAGVGKTALALHWAHRVRKEFPDGDLYINLRGYDPEPPVTSEEALSHFLRALGTPASDIPPSVAEKSALYRSLLASRKILVVLDNASSEDQVRPLLPGNAGCVVVVTSRNALAGLVSRDGARRITLDLLSTAEAVTLLREVLRVVHEDADDTILAELAALCSHLPLALRIAGEIVAFRPQRPIAALVAELADVRERLRVLSSPEDKTVAVRAVFSWSYKTLSDETALLFRRLGLHVTPDFGGPVAAALAGISVPDAQTGLEELARAHLVEEPTPGRFRFHDLLRAYATEMAHADDSAEDTTDAVKRMLAFYRNGAEEAAATTPHQPHEPPKLAPDAAALISFTDAREAQSWCESERANLIAALQLAKSLTDEAAWRIPVALRGFFGNTLPRNEFLEVAEGALVVAGALADSHAHAWSHQILADVYHGYREFKKAAHLYDQAALRWQALDDLRGHAMSTYCCGVAAWNMGNLRVAEEQWQTALQLWQSVEDASGVAIAHHALAYYYWLQEKPDQALEHHEAAEALAAAHVRYDDFLPQRLPRSVVGDTDERISYLLESLKTHQQSKNRLAEAWALWDLANADTFKATPYLEKAVEIFADLDGDMHRKAQKMLDDRRCGIRRSDDTTVLPVQAAVSRPPETSAHDLTPPAPSADGGLRFLLVAGPCAFSLLLWVLDFRVAAGLGLLVTALILWALIRRHR